MHRLTVCILSWVVSVALTSSAQAARPIADYYNALGLPEGAPAEQVDQALVSTLAQALGTDDKADAFGRALEAHVVRGTVDPEAFQALLETLSIHPSEIFVGPSQRKYLEAIEAFVMIRAQELSAEAREKIDFRSVERSFESWQTGVQSGARANELQAGRRSRWNQGLALVLSWGISKLMLEHVLFLANATGSRTWLAASVATLVLYLYLPRFYVQHPEMNFHGFKGWIVGAYGRALVSSLGSTMVIGGCVKLLRSAF